MKDSQQARKRASAEVKKEKYSVVLFKGKRRVTSSGVTERTDRRSLTKYLNDIIKSIDNRLATTKEPTQIALLLQKKFNNQKLLANSSRKVALITKIDFTREMEFDTLELYKGKTLIGRRSGPEYLYRVQDGTSIELTWIFTAKLLNARIKKQ